MKGALSAICIGCGCDDQHACNVLAELAVDGHGCWWLRFDADAGLGVCSACHDLVRAWDASRQHTPNLPLIAERYYRQVMSLYEDKAGAIAWMNAPQPLLGNRAPRELILAGELDKVRTVVDAMLSGAYQ